MEVRVITDKQEEERKPYPAGWKERRAYVILVIISVVLSISSFLLSVQVAKTNEKKFCDIINSVVAVPVPRPSDPQKDPSRERAYIFDVKFKSLDESLGC
jgi:hypothetical protein